MVDDEDEDDRQLVQQGVEDDEDAEQRFDVPQPPRGFHQPLPMATAINTSTTIIKAKAKPAHAHLLV